MSKIRIKSLMVFVLICLVVFSGCSKETYKSELRVSTQPTIYFRITWDESSGRGEVISKLVDRFNGTSQRAFVELIGGNENQEEYVEGLAEDVVDVYVIPYRYVKLPEVSESLVDLEQIFETEWQYYSDTILDMVSTEKGKVAIPWIGHSMCLIFNQDIVSKADVNPHLFHSPMDLLEGAQKISEKTGYAGIGLVGANHHDLSWMINQFIYTFNGELVSSDEENFGEIVINSQESVNALDFYINQLGAYAQEGWQDHTGVEILDQFAEGNIGMEIQGPWAVSDIWKKGNPFPIGVVPLDQMGIYSEVGPLMLGIDKDTDNMAGAVEFVSFLSSDEAQEIIMNGEYDERYDSYYPFRVPIKSSTIEAEFFNKYQEFKGFVEGFNLPSISTPNQEWAMLEGRYTYYIHEAIMGNMTIEEALEEVVP